MGVVYLIETKSRTELSGEKEADHDMSFNLRVIEVMDEGFDLVGKAWRVVKNVPAPKSTLLESPHVIPPWMFAQAGRGCWPAPRTANVVWRLVTKGLIVFKNVETSSAVLARAMAAGVISLSSAER